MRLLHIFFIYILLLSYTNTILTGYALSQTESSLSIDRSINKAAELADQKQKEAQQTATLINNYYNKGKACYQSRGYTEAIRYFEKILDIDPSYEPAKLYIEGAIIRQRIVETMEEIRNIKLRMADIIAEYDRRREYMDSLAIKYFLEQAQIRCQLGDYEGAGNLYNLCYRAYPLDKAKIEWFVKATYDLIKLSQTLDEHSRKIEELAASMNTSTF